MKYFKYTNSKWIECEKSELSAGDKYASVDSYGTRVESFWPGEKQKPNKIVITSHNKRAIVMQGGDSDISAEIQDSEGNLLDVTDDFAMPVGKVGAGNYTTLLMPFVNGRCTRSYTWNDAGEFEVTQAMINMHLDESEKFDFDGFNITVAG